MPAPCVLRRCATRGTPAIPFREKRQAFGICRSTPETSEELLRPVGDGAGAGDDRPFVGAIRLHAEAVFLGAFPGGAETILRKLPCPFRLGTALAQRLAR